MYCSAQGSLHYAVQAVVTLCLQKSLADLAECSCKSSSRHSCQYAGTPRQQSLSRFRICLECKPYWLQQQRSRNWHTCWSEGNQLMCQCRCNYLHSSLYGRLYQRPSLWHLSLWHTCWGMRYTLADWSRLGSIDHGTVRPKSQLLRWMRQRLGANLKAHSCGL